MNDNQKKVERSKVLASVIHKGDKYNGMTYMQGHLDRAEVMLEEMILAGMLPYTEVNVTDLKCALYLHDTLEDHPDKITFRDICDGFGQDVAEAVKIVTKTADDPDYAEYIIRVLSSDNLLAICTKFVDLAVNIETSMNKDSLTRYEKGRVSRYKLATLLISHQFEQMQETGCSGCTCHEGEKNG
jgi:(p)ppGpp synthase/HD superfamily hydrolase